MSMLIDFLLVTLLAATCGYCFMLNKKLNELRSAQHTLGDAITTFDEASKRAQDNIVHMDQLARRKSGETNGTLVRGQDIVAELSIMVSAGERIAERIEAAIHDVKAAGKKSPKQSRPAPGRSKAA